MEQILKNIVDSVYSDEYYNKEYSRIYKLHKYWARKPWYIVEKYIEKYSSSGSTVMDPFCGSGCTGLEAILNGRNFIGQDLNPAALHVSEGTLKNITDVLDFDDDFLKISSAVKDTIMNLYITKNTCKKCNNPIYYKHICSGPAFKDNYIGKTYCPNCKAKSDEIPLSENQMLEQSNITDKKITTWTPGVMFPEKFYKDRFSYKGIHLVDDMYTRRNLYALSVLYDAINSIELKNKEFFTLAFTNTILHSSKLKGENVRPMGVNSYWIPDDYIEENVWFRFEDRVKNIKSAKIAQKKREQEKLNSGIKFGKWVLNNKSALDDMGTECVDYFFTDPPYGDAIQYSELSFMWNAWLGKKFDITEEIIINPVQNKGEFEFDTMLSGSLGKIYKALKNNCYFTLCFQNKNFSVWKSIIKKCKELGFSLTDVSIYDTYGSPFNKHWANFSPKSDIYVTFQKSERNEMLNYNSNETISSIIFDIYIYSKENGIYLDKNRLYDFTIAYFIWTMFSNDSDIDIANFSIKSFGKIVDDIIQEYNLNFS